MSQHRSPRHSRPDVARASRVIAALAYVGPLSLIIAAPLPRSRFIMRHALIAMATHLLRFAWAGLTIALWLYLGAAHPERLATLATDLGILLLAGVPWFPSMPWELFSLLALPLGLTWLVSLIGIAVAASGHTLDLQALLHADWPDVPAEPLAAPAPRRDERRYARELQERRLERMWNASAVAQSEHRRQERIEQVKRDLEMVLQRLNHLNHLLSLGEISLSRFDAMHADLISYLDALRRELIDLQSRRADTLTSGTRPVAPLALTQLTEVQVQTLAVLDPGGTPIYTVGYFSLDESLITGMVSALDSLSEEMFGSRVHKTQLAEGQVVHFARGRLTIAFAIFEDEPAPVQIGQLRDFLDTFEQANAALLARPPVDPAGVASVPMPFSFARRLADEPKAEPVSATHAP